MSNLQHPSRGEAKTRSSAVPRAMIHKQILEAAESHPHASIEELAADISGASMGLVERVLSEYGDPVENESSLGDQETTDHDEQSDASAIHNDATMNSEEIKPVQVPDLVRDALTEKQLTTLRAIYRHPNATQQELADQLGVCKATISQRVNAINGFEWAHRQQFVDQLFENGDMELDDLETDPQVQPIQDLSDQVAGLTERVKTVEQRLETEADPAPSVFADPDIASRVAQACIHFEHISQEEEQQILKELMTSTRAQE